MTSTQELVTAVRSAKQYLTYVSAGPFQYAVAEALRLPHAYFDSFRDDLRRKRDLLGQARPWSSRGPQTLNHTGLDNLVRALCALNAPTAPCVHSAIERSQVLS